MSTFLSSDSLQPPQRGELKILDPDRDISLVIPDKGWDTERLRSGTSSGP